MNTTDRAIRLACRLVVLVWIAALLGWRELAPRELHVPVRTTSLETVALPPPEPEPESAPDPDPISETPAPPPAPAPPEPTREVAAAPDAEPEPVEPVDLGEALEEVDAPELAESVAPQSEIAKDAIVEAPPAPPEPIHETPPAPPLFSASDAPPEPPTFAEQPLPIEAVKQSDAAPIPLQAVAETDVVRGGTLLTGEGGFPMLESRYESYGSFRDYARAMLALGAKFVIVERRAIVGTIDPWTLEAGTLRDAASLSPRARDYAREPALLSASRTVRRRHGNRAEVMLLVPRRIDAALFGGIARALEARGQEPGAYRQIQARYERGPGGGLLLRVEKAIRKDGHEEPLPLLFDLGSLVRA